MKTRTIFQRDPRGNTEREREKKGHISRDVDKGPGGENRKNLHPAENFLTAGEQVVRETYFRSKKYLLGIRRTGKAWTRT